MEQVLKDILNLPPPRRARGFITDMTCTSFVAAPLFYDQPLVLYCRHCEISKSPQLVRWAIEEGLLIPVLKTPYADQPVSVVAPISTLRHVSFRATQALIAAWAHRENYGCYCVQCAWDGLIPFKHLPREDSRFIERNIINLLATIPTEIRKEGHAIVNRAISAESSKALRYAREQLEVLKDVCIARSLGAIPQFRATSPSAPNATSSEDLAVMTMALGITVPEGVPDLEYMEIIRDHRGALAPLLTDGSEATIARAIERCEAINAEVEEIRRSKRLRVLQIGTRIYRENRARILKMALGGTVGFATHGLAGGAIGGFAGVGLEHLARGRPSAEGKPVARSPEKHHEIMATYFGRSVEAIHVWKLQERTQPT